jgi:exopolysaccharide production protein ExoQ
MSRSSPLAASTAPARYLGPASNLSSTRTPSGSDAVRPPKPRVEQRLSWPIATILTALVFISFGEISPSLLPSFLSGNGQQAIILLLWIILSAALATSPRTASIGEGDFVLIGLFYAVPIFSVLWSENPIASLPKCSALAITTFSVWLCAFRLSVRDYATCACIGLSLLLTVSLVLIIFVPEIGLMHTWQQAGLWTGTFNNKQSLGVAAAVLTAFSINLFLYAGKKILLLAILLSFAIALGSGSRGGIGALGISVIVSVCVWRVRSTLLRQLIAVVPLLIVCAVAVLIIELIVTGKQTLELYGFDLSINSRTFIWQYAIQLSSNALFLGTGLDAFWHNDVYYFEFLQNHGWILNDFHNGYLEILIETGLLGCLLLIIITLRLTYRLGLLAQFKFEYAAISLFMVMFYLLNASETFFLRSTSFMQTTFLFFLIKTVTHPTRSGSTSGAKPCAAATMLKPLDSRRRQPC